MLLPTPSVKNSSRLLTYAAFLSAFLACSAPTAYADLVAFTPQSDGGTSLGNFSSTLGYDFTVNDTITITEVGAFDAFFNGFANGTVGIRFWNISGSAASPLFQVNNGDALMDLQFQAQDLMGDSATTMLLTFYLLPELTRSEQISAILGLLLTDLFGMPEVFW